MNTAALYDSLTKGQANSTNVQYRNSGTTSLMQQRQDSYEGCVSLSDYQDASASAPILSMKLIENAVNKLKQQNPTLQYKKSNFHTVKSSSSQSKTEVHGQYGETAAKAASPRPKSQSCVKTVFNRMTANAPAMLHKVNQVSQRSGNSNQSISSRDESSARSNF